ncbi:MerC domain-containing protein [Spirosoma rigui]|uniref:MerC domain-containing protein n=1 Tax=Spirosoma rigui TaxID=564064 RepID=UPI0009AF80E0|nr:MerC domain-containing protein [Spirosoma rigui]
MLNSLRVQAKADYLGILGSIGCIIHCLITPVLVMTSTLLRNDSLRTGFLSLDYLFIAINIMAVWSASRHTSRRLARSLWLCLTLFTIGLLLEKLDARFAYLAYAASLGLVVTHVLNIRRHTH